MLPISQSWATQLCGQSAPSCVVRAVPSPFPGWADTQPQELLWCLLVETKRMFLYNCCFSLHPVGAVSTIPDFLSSWILLYFQLVLVDLRAVSLASLDSFSLCCLRFQVSTAGQVVTLELEGGSLLSLHSPFLLSRRVWLFAFDISLAGPQSTALCSPHI